MPLQSANSLPLSTVMLLNTWRNIAVPMRRSSRSRTPTTLAAVSSCILRMISSRVTRPVRTHRAALVPFLPTTLSISQWPGSSRLLMCSGRCSMLSPLGAFAAFTRL